MSLGAVAMAAAATLVRTAVPYVLAASGGALSERSGVPHIALEGCMVAGAFCTAAVTLATGSSALGLLGGATAGGAVGLVHAVCTQKLRIDGIISGFACNLGVIGLARVLLRVLYSSNSNSPSVVSAKGRGALLSALLDPFTLFAVGIAFCLPYIVQKTRFGLALRAVGEEPSAARALGVSIERTRMLAVTLGSTLAGLGGGALVSELHQFQTGMTGGRGFLALAAVILGGWDIRKTIAAALALAVLEGGAVLLQVRFHVSPELVAMLPYLIALIVLALVGKREGRGAPAGMGQFGDE